MLLPLKLLRILSLPLITVQGYNIPCLQNSFLQKLQYTRAGISRAKQNNSILFIYNLWTKIYNWHPTTLMHSFESWNSTHRQQLDFSVTCTHLNNRYCDKAKCEALCLGNASWRTAACVLNAHENNFWVTMDIQQSLNFLSMALWLQELMRLQKRYGSKSTETN